MKSKNENGTIEYPIKDAKRLRRSFLIIQYVIPLQFFSHFLADNNSDNAILYVLLIVLSLLLTLVMITAPAFELGVLDAKLEDFEKKKKIDTFASDSVDLNSDKPFQFECTKALYLNDSGELNPDIPIPGEINRDVIKLKKFIHNYNKLYSGKEIDPCLVQITEFASKQDKKHLGKEMKSVRCRKD